GSTKCLRCSTSSKYSRLPTGLGECRILQGLPFQKASTASMPGVGSSCGTGSVLTVIVVVSIPIFHTKNVYISVRTMCHADAIYTSRGRWSSPKNAAHLARKLTLPAATGYAIGAPRAGHRRREEL